jgi:hypothetical protein
MTDTVFQSSVLLCNVGDCSCPVCNFLNGDRQAETLLRVIRVLDDKLANTERFEREYLLGVIREQERAKA